MRLQKTPIFFTGKLCTFLPVFFWVLTLFCCFWFSHLLRTSLSRSGIVKSIWAILKFSNFLVYHFPSGPVPKAPWTPNRKERFSFGLLCSRSWVYRVISECSTDDARSNVVVLLWPNIRGFPLMRIVGTGSRVCVWPPGTCVAIVSRLLSTRFEFCLLPCALPSDWKISFLGPRGCKWQGSPIFFMDFYLKDSFQQFHKILSIPFCVWLVLYFLIRYSSQFGVSPMKASF